MKSLGNIPQHVAIIMDGNGRWAEAQGLPRINGHKKGADVAKSIALSAQKLGISYLTLYTFSSENWQRPKIEINALFDILKFYLSNEQDIMHKSNIKVSVIGNLENVPGPLKKQIDQTVLKTQYNTGMTLIIAFIYGARNEIVTAAKALLKSSKEINEASLASHLYTKDIPDPDLLIRTGGEKRISNFLLWQIAYTELLFMDKYWPDFTSEDLLFSLKAFQSRERRYGK